MLTPFKKGERLAAQKLNQEIHKASLGSNNFGSRGAKSGSSIRFYNDTGVDISIGEIASIDSTKGTYNNDFIYFGNMKAVDGDSTYWSVWFADTDIKSGAVGSFTHAGVLKAVVDVTNNTHGYAKWVSGDTYLTSCEEITPYRIVMVGQLITGTRSLCVIECGDMSNMPINLRFTTVSTDGLSYLCESMDGLTTGIEVAFPWLLRKTSYNGLTINGITYTYTDGTTREATNGLDTWDEVIHMPYFSDDIITVVVNNGSLPDVASVPYVEISNNRIWGRAC